MNLWYSAGGVVSLLLFGYLVFVIWNPEKF
ncbi:K(+)-transporting ATPase subunit F [Thermodesulfitimonas autotrophica]